MRKFFSIFLALAFLNLAAYLAAADKSDYRLQPSDVLTITVHGQPDLTTRTRITSYGDISFPLLGKVPVRGLTVRDVEEKLKELLEADYLVTAQVLVFIEEYRSRQVSVIGEVNKPGKYDMPLERSVTLLEAIAMAGGFTKDADTRNVSIMRMEAGRQKTVRINVKDITDKGAKEKDPLIEPDDVVVVPESFF